MNPNLQQSLDVMSNPTQGAPSSPYPDIAKLYDSSFKLAGQAPAAAAVSASDSITVANRRAAAAAGASAQRAAIAKKLDPRNWPKRRNQSGGYDFFDPDGNKISLTKWVKVQQALGEDATRESALEGSTNGLDLQYLNDVRSFNTMLEADRRQDETFFADLRTANPDFIKAVKGKKIEDLAGRLRQNYADYYDVTPIPRAKIKKGKVGVSAFPYLESVEGTMTGGYVPTNPQTFEKYANMSEDDFTIAYEQLMNPGE